MREDHVVSALQYLREAPATLGMARHAARQLEYELEERNEMSDNTWKQIRRTALMAWGLAIATYLIVVSGGDVDSAVGVASVAVSTLGVKFGE